MSYADALERDSSAYARCDAKCHLGVLLRQQHRLARGIERADRRRDLLHEHRRQAQRRLVEPVPILDANGLLIAMAEVFVALTHAEIVVKPAVGYYNRRPDEAVLDLPCADGDCHLEPQELGGDLRLIIDASAPIATPARVRVCESDLTARPSPTG